MHKQKTLISSVFLLFSLFSSVHAQESLSLGQRIDSLLQTTQPRQFNGVIRLTKGSQTVYEKAFGFANLESNKPLKMETISS